MFTDLILFTMKTITQHWVKGEAGFVPVAKELERWEIKRNVIRHTLIWNQWNEFTKHIPYLLQQAMFLGRASLFPM